MLEIDKNKVQINLGPNVGNMTTRYDPPKRGRVNLHGGLLKEAHRIYKAMGYYKTCSWPKPRGGLRPIIVNLHV